MRARERAAKTVAAIQAQLVNATAGLAACTLSDIAPAHAKGSAEEAREEWWRLRGLLSYEDVPQVAKDAHSGAVALRRKAK